MKATVAMLLLLCSWNAAWGQTLKRIATIDLPGPPGERFDYLTMDYEDHYLLSAHLDPGILYVIDVRTNQLVKAIPGVPGITGVEYVPGLKKVYTSNRGENEIGVVDLKQLKVISRLPADIRVNGSTYAEPFGKIYVSDTQRTGEAIVDVHKNVITKTLRFNGTTGMPQYDPVGKKVWINVQSINEIAELDPASDEVVGQYPVAGCQFNHGMALDPKGRRAFLLCNTNHVLTVFDLDTHRSIASIPVPEGADVVKFDPGLKRIYAACSSGAISVIQEDEPNHFRKLEDFPVERNVHSLTVDITTHRVYAPEQEENGEPVARMVIYEAIAGR